MGGEQPPERVDQWISNSSKAEGKEVAEVKDRDEAQARGWAEAAEISPAPDPKEIVSVPSAATNRLMWPGSDALTCPVLAVEPG